MIKKVLAAAFGVGLAFGVASANAMVVFSDNFDDGDVSDWVKSTNYGGPTFVETNGTAVSGQSLFTYLTAPPGGTDLVVSATKSFNAPVAGDYVLSLFAVSTACDGCTVSYQGLRMKFSGDDLGHILVVPGGLFAPGLEGYLGS